MTPRGARAVPDACGSYRVLSANVHCEKQKRSAGNAAQERRKTGGDASVTDQLTTLISEARLFWHQVLRRHDGVQTPVSWVPYASVVSVGGPGEP